MEDKEQLTFILSVLKQIPLSETNKWFWNEVLEVGGVDKIEPTRQEKTNEEVEISRKIIRYQKYKIDTIYEIAVRDKMRVQAASFYESFRIIEIKDSLIYDFVRMEHYRRNDDFENFCLALHQQIENIVNYLCENDKYFQIQISMDKDKFVYEFKPKQHKLWELILSTFKNEEDAIKLFNQELLKWEYKLKLKAVLYYYNFKQDVKYKYNEFIAMFKALDEIYQSRNLNHRGGFQYDNQKEITNKILDNQHRNYLKFLGILERFVSEV